MMRATRRLFVVAIVLTLGGSLEGRQLPLSPDQDAVRFIAIGDMGTGKKPQFELAAAMETARKTFPFEFAIMLGDNIYDGDTAADFRDKFELPYQALLGGGVKFYAALGNHDGRNQSRYAPFNMGGEPYYTFRKGNVEFFALDSNYMSPKQLAWLEKKLENSDAEWKIPYFHHPFYSSATFHGSAVELRLVIEPLFVKYGVQVVFAGHEHVYERVKPQKGITYFVEGASGQLRKGNLTKGSSLTASGFDTDLSFIQVAVAGDLLSYQTISRTGATVDSGTIARVPSTATATQ